MRRNDRSKKQTHGQEKSRGGTQYVVCSVWYLTASRPGDVQVLEGDASHLVMAVPGPFCFFHVPSNGWVLLALQALCLVFVGADDSWSCLPWYSDVVAVQRMVVARGVGATRVLKVNGLATDGMADVAADLGRRSHVSSHDCHTF